jgi:hypothetical protein
VIVFQVIRQVCIAHLGVANGSWLHENSEIEFANGNFVSTSIDLENKKRWRRLPGQDRKQFCVLFVRARFHAARVNRVVLIVGRPLPVSPDNRASSMSVGMSQKSQKRTHPMNGPLVSKKTQSTTY